MSLDDLFLIYELSKTQKSMFENVKITKNMPSFFDSLSDEEIIWAILNATFDMSKDSPTESDIKFYSQKVEERVRRLEEAENRYKWFSIKWDRKFMKKLLVNWFCGIMVIDPELKTVD